MRFRGDQAGRSPVAPSVSKDACGVVEESRRSRARTIMYRKQETRVQGRYYTMHTAVECVLQRNCEVVERVQNGESQLAATPTDDGPWKSTHTPAAHTQPMMTHAAVQSTSNPTHIDRARPDDGSSVVCLVVVDGRQSTYSRASCSLSHSTFRPCLRYKLRVDPKPKQQILPAASVCLWDWSCSTTKQCSA